MAELPFPALTDGLVVLRRWRPADVVAQLKAFRDPVFGQFSDWAPETVTEAHARMIEQEEGRVRGELIDFARVEVKEPAVLLGGVSLNDVDRAQGRASIGYWLTPGARGRGVMTHAVRLLAWWALDDLQLARLELTCGPDNVASQGVAERCGFSCEGLLRSHLPFKGGRRDTAVFSLLPGELR